MKKYTNPQIEVTLLEVNDIITASGSVFDGLANLDKSENSNWSEEILDPKDIF